jgi:hypothetical protein
VRFTTSAGSSLPKVRWRSMLKGEDQTLKRSCARTCGLKTLFTISHPALGLRGSLTFWIVSWAAGWAAAPGGVGSVGGLRRSAGGKESGGRVYARDPRARWAVGAGVAAGRSVCEENTGALGVVTDGGGFAGGLGRALDMRGKGSKTGCVLLALAAVSAVCTSEVFTYLLGLSNLSKNG